MHVPLLNSYMSSDATTEEENQICLGLAKLTNLVELQLTVHSGKLLRSIDAIANMIRPIKQLQFIEVDQSDAAEDSPSETVNLNDRLEHGVKLRFQGQSVPPILQRIFFGIKRLPEIIR